jgi:threonine aldolase
MKMIDLRSDTVTQPTPEMREAMYRAEVGDDVYEEDPTINRLQELSAGLMGKEEGLFVTSGTMGNLIAVLGQCQRGDEALMGHLGHTFLFEAGGISALGGIFAHTLQNQPDGTLGLEELQQSIRPDDIHQPRTRLVILENTHNRCGGVVLSKVYCDQVGAWAHERGLKVHLDGARIFNASVALHTPAKELTTFADSVTFCLSKGLAAPVGSVLCGDHEFIEKARRLRKMLGGGMRQAGIVAAAGIVALNTMVDRLAEDHARAYTLAERLSTLPEIEFEMGMPQTNMVFPSLRKDLPLTAAELSARLKEKGVLAGTVGPKRLRMVMHYGLDDEDVDMAFAAVKECLAEIK